MNIRQTNRCGGVAIAVGLIMGLSPAVASGEDRPTMQFEKHQLTKEYFAEGASFGDFNQDGKRDVVCGPQWFEGPEFKRSHVIYAGTHFPNDRGYSDNFFSFVADFSGDGWDDVLVVGLPGTPAHWYENPRNDQPWAKHFAFAEVDNEAPLMADLTGDGHPELVCTFHGQLGYAKQDRQRPDAPWQWHPVSERGNWHRFSHGLGIGDVNGDRRLDFLTPTGWWEQPENASELWHPHPFPFCQGGAQMHTDDVDGDGDQDIVTSLQAHAWGLSWFEQVSKRDGEPQFKEHKIMGRRPEESSGGVCFSQLHAVELADVNGDGLRDIVTGKCYWAHNGSDPGARDPAVIYCFLLTRGDDGVRYVPFLVDDDSGVGRQVTVADMNGDGLVDIVTGNKKGTFVMIRKR